jgi:hypothetical protein
MRADQVPDVWPRFRFIDPGYNAACAVLWGAIDGDGVRYVYDELYLRKHLVSEIASRMKAKTGRQRIEFTLIDPEAYKKTQVGKTIAEMYCENGIVVDQATANKTAGILAVGDLLNIRDNGHPNLRVCAHCTHFIDEIEHYRYKETDPDEPEKEKPIDINDHLMACAYFFAMSVGSNYTSSRADPYSSMRRYEEVLSVKQAATKQIEYQRRKRRFEDMFDDEF